MGKRANDSYILNSVCVCVMPAGRIPITEWLAVIEIAALTFFVTCQYSVARGAGINASRLWHSRWAEILMSCRCSSQWLVDTPQQHKIQIFVLSNYSAFLWKAGRCASSCHLSVQEQTNILDPVYPLFHQNYLSLEPIYCRSLLLFSFMDFHLNGGNLSRSMSTLHGIGIQLADSYQPQHKTPENTGPSSLFS